MFTFGGYFDFVSTESRRVLSRLVHRVGFGPKPGQFQTMLAKGFSASVSDLVYSARPAYGDVKVMLGITDLGPQPAPNSEAVVQYADSKRGQLRAISLWWLDQMVGQDFPFHERMTWFWHGHWATSYAKVDEPVVMFDHVDRLRQHATADFGEMCEAMTTDAALIYWLDGQLNSAKSPNENLARELMELFTLGVNRYTEVDIKEASKALAGWQVVKSSGLVYRNVNRTFNGSTAILGRTDNFDAVSLARFLSQQPACQRFIPERLWFRFISSTTTPAVGSDIEIAFAQRQILPAIVAMVQSEAFADPQNDLVKSPLEWLVAVLRALRITPSTYAQPDSLLSLLTALGQRPLFPPNVGGWPGDEVWLSASAAQTRIQAAQTLCSRGDLTPVTSVPASARVDALADWLGVAGWCDRTRSVLNGAVSDPRRLVTLAICSPDYVVNQ